MIDGLLRLPLRRFEDERGWFAELMRASALPKPVRQSNLVSSRKGVVRALHYHERGQLDVRRVEGWWHDGGKHWADLADVGRLIEQTGANK